MLAMVGQPPPYSFYQSVWPAGKWWEGGRWWLTDEAIILARGVSLARGDRSVLGEERPPQVFLRGSKKDKYERRKNEKNI